MATIDNQHNDNIRNKRSTSVAVGAAGIIIGAAMGGIAGAALSNEKNRKVLKQKVKQLTKHVKKNFDEITDNTHDATISAKELADTTKTTHEKIGDEIR